MLQPGLAGRLCVVAGAGGGGIGTATCRMLADAGATILAIDKTEAGCAVAREALTPHGGAHRVVQADLCDAGILAEAIVAMDAPVHGLVNIVGGIAAREMLAPLVDSDAVAIFERLMRFNTIPTFTAAQVVARAMIAHGGGGSIVNIASAAGQISMPFASGYAAAKAALINLTRTMAVEWGPASIRVNAVAPGSIATAKLGRVRYDEGRDAADAIAKTVVPLGRRGTSEDIAGVVLFLMSDLSSYVSGQTIGVDGGMLARPPYNDGDELPVFMADPLLRQRLLDARS